MAMVPPGQNSPIDLKFTLSKSPFLQKMKFYIIPICYYTDEIVQEEDSGVYKVLIGNREWMRENNLTVTDEMDHSMAQYEGLGQTAVLVAINGMYIVFIANTFQLQFYFLQMKFL